MNCVLPRPCAKALTSPSSVSNLPANNANDSDSAWVTKTFVKYKSSWSATGRSTGMAGGKKPTGLGNSAPGSADRRRLLPSNSAVVILGDGASSPAGPDFLFLHLCMSEFNRIEISQISGSAGNVTVVQVMERRLQEQGVIQELSKELESLAPAEQPKNILLNLSRVDFISSAALNKLITYHNRVKKAGGQLKLAELKPQIEEVFAITRLNKHFDIRADEGAALSSY